MTGDYRSRPRDSRRSAAMSPPEELQQYNARFTSVIRAKKTIYLTFDAGYENGCTPAILDALKA